MPEEIRQDYNDAPIQIEKLALHSNEIDTNTGRIILPTAGMLNQMKENETYVAPVPVPAPPLASSPLNTPPTSALQQDTATAAMPIPQVSPALQTTVDTPPYSPKNKSNILDKLSFTLSFFIFLALVWIGYEIHQANTALKLSASQPVEQSIPILVTPQVSTESISKKDVRDLVETTQKMYEEFPTLLKQTEIAVSELKAEVEGLEFEFVDADSSDTEKADESELTAEVVETIEPESTTKTEKEPSELPSP